MNFTAINKTDAKAFEYINITHAFFDSILIFTSFNSKSDICRIFFPPAS